MYNRIIILCPAKFASGGPELLHQLGSTLRKFKFNAFICYYSINKVEYKDPVNPSFANYNVPYILYDEYKNEDSDIIVVPEVYFNLAKQLSKGMIMLWWLSVDNAYSFYDNYYHMRAIRKLSKILNRVELYNRFKQYRMKRQVLRFFSNDRTIHLVQSYYAEDFCEKIGIEKNKIYYLSDYINLDFLEKNDKVRKDIVLYNPKKGIEYTKKIIDSSSGIKWKALINLSRSEMISALQTAKVYVDFGNHPGKDRIPREAAMCGCCIITGRRGSANFSKDVNIPDEYKFNDDEVSIPKIINKINEIFNDYDAHNNSFNDYRKAIILEKNNFEKDALNVFNSYIEIRDEA